ncbi:MAG: type II toxin-antitoxin system HicA family toxin [Solirubrobacterales bacterium]
MSPRQPVVSGKALVRALERDGWSVVRQRGSHVRLKKAGCRHALAFRSTRRSGRERSPESCVMPG